jgi:dihydroflavonol-4-reductase
MGVVDVRDAARAHVAAMESEAAAGRYLINARSCFLLSEARAWLRTAHPQLWVPPLLGPWWGVLWCGPYMGLPRQLARAMLYKLPAIDANKAARDLGMTPESYITPQQSVLDMADALLERGMVPAFQCPVMPLMVALTLLTLLAVPLVAWGLLLLARALLALQQAWA